MWSTISNQCKKVVVAQSCQISRSLADNLELKKDNKLALKFVIWASFSIKAEGNASTQGQNVF